MNAIEFDRVTKSFARHAGPMLIRDRIAGLIRKVKHDRFYALTDVSFKLEHGAGLAVVGANGAGKSTLLSMVAGLCIPDSGSIRVSGRIAPLLQLGSGFHQDLTGAENIWINASLIGLTRRRTRELFDEIVEFSGIGDFIHEPLRTYSSGMVLRLAFSVAINMDPDILLVDEILAVGDAAFQEKCHDRIAELRRNGKTLLCVSHSAVMVQKFCDEAIWLDHGRLVSKGPVRRVLEEYEGSRAAAMV